MQKKNQVCVSCVMDTTDPDIEFDASGVCSHCNRFERIRQHVLLDENSAQLELERIVGQMKDYGRGKEYDCILGLSGGVDSSYVAYLATKKLGLRPLVFHIDTGWNSELAVNNIENIVKTLGIDLHTLVLDWEEIRDLQLAFFRASLANLDIPQDHAFSAGLHSEARKYGIKYALNGGNLATESILPAGWGYDSSDSWHLLDVHKKFGEVKLKRYPLLSFFMKRVYIPYVHRSRPIRLLNYIDYNKEAVKRLLIEELGWRDYGGKHYESRFTKFFQAHYLPTKFGFDKRKAHLSSLIVSNQLSREEAMDELSKPLYDPTELEEDIEYFVKKLRITRDEYEKIMKQPPRSHTEFANQVWLNNLVQKTARTFGMGNRLRDSKK